MAVEVISRGMGDAPMLPGLLAPIPADHDSASVTADGACNTRKCRDATAGRGVRAVMPPCRNGGP